MISAYLRRIGFLPVKLVEASFTTLCNLQRLHLESVPYENLDIMRGIPISLEIDNLFDKIVTRRRGGYCFELNGLFAWLLRGLGFKVTEYLSRYLRDEEKIPMRRHRVLRVGVGGDCDYLCDVGVGGTIPRQPLAYKKNVVSQQNGESYLLKEEDFFGMVLYERQKDTWRRIYSFTEEEQATIDYTMPSFYCEKHPNSLFRTMDMVHIFTRNGRKSIADRKFREYNHKGTKTIMPATERDYKELLFVHFGIKF